MKRKVIQILVFITGTLLMMSYTFSQDDVRSLRGKRPLDAKSTKPVVKSWQADRPPIIREYVHQPPLIPHKTEGYIVNKKFNKCLTCHSWSNYREAGATKISLTHFSDRDGNDLANVSARRYFCNQCHVPQVNANPLVENTFKPVRAIRGE